MTLRVLRAQLCLETSQSDQILWSTISILLERINIRNNDQLVDSCNNLGFEELEWTIKMKKYGSENDLEGKTATVHD